MITRQHPDGRIEIVNPLHFYPDPSPEIISMMVTPIEPEDPQQRTAREVRAVIEEHDHRLMKLRPRLQAHQNEMMGKFFEMLIEREKARDPRLDPKEGDELRKPRRRNGQMLYRRVWSMSSYRHRGSSRRRGVVYFVEHIAGWTGEVKGQSLKDWRAWAKGAQVAPRFPGTA